MKCRAAPTKATRPQSHPVRGAWVEIRRLAEWTNANKSHPVRGAWVEILLSHLAPVSAGVAPREGCVG